MLKTRSCPHSLLHASLLLPTPREARNRLEAPKPRRPLCQRACLQHHPLAKSCLFGFFFFFADPHKKGNRLGYRSLPGQGCRGSVPVPTVRRDVFCCGLLLLVGSPWGPVWTSAAGGEIKSKGQRGKEERLEQGWEHGVDPAPTDRSPMAGHGTWAQQGWEEDSPAGSMAGAGIRRVGQQMGLAGSAVNYSARGKL